MITYLFAGGGTGGHLYPGLAIAEQIRKLARTPVKTLFICSDRPLDREILERAGVEFVISEARPLSLRLSAGLRFVQAWGKSVRRCRELIAEHQRPNKPAGDGAGTVVLVAMGGFVAAPAAKAAFDRQVPIVLVNLDAVPGKANRWIARRACSVYSSARPRPDGGLPDSTVVVPPIVRAQASAGLAVESSSIGRAECRRRLGLDPEAQTLMVTGGSQGARSINEFVTRFALSDAGQHALRIDPRAAGRPAWQIIHQTGRDADSSVAEAYRRAGIQAVVRPFAEGMGDWWGAADLAIARAGAGNVAEVWANRVPTIFMPYPHHADDHQRYNAMPIEQAGGCRITRDLIDPDRNLETAGPVLRSLLESSELRKQMWAALEKLGPADGARRVAEALIELATPAAGYAR